MNKLEFLQMLLEVIDCDKLSERVRLNIIRNEAETALCLVEQDDDEQLSTSDVEPVHRTITKLRFENSGLRHTISTIREDLEKFLNGHHFVK